MHNAVYNFIVSGPTPCGVVSREDYDVTYLIIIEILLLFLVCNYYYECLQSKLKIQMTFVLKQNQKINRWSTFHQLRSAGKNKLSIRNYKKLAHNIRVQLFNPEDSILYYASKVEPVRHGVTECKFMIFGNPDWPGVTYVIII